MQNVARHTRAPRSEIKICMTLSLYHTYRIPSSQRSITGTESRSSFEALESQSEIYAPQKSCAGFDDTVESCI